MKHVSRSFAPAAVMAVCVIAANPVRAGDSPSNLYVVTPLVSDLPQGARTQDPNLKNAWGVAFSPGASPFWVADNATGLSTLYDGAGNIVNLVVTIPCPPRPGQGSSCPQTAAPTGLVWNPSSAFLVPGTSSPASFIWATEDGTISAWAGGLTPNPNNARLAVDNSVSPTATMGAVYKGLAVGNLLQRFASRGPLNSPWGVARASAAFGLFSGDILVGNFGNGRISAFDSDGNFLGPLINSKGNLLHIDGLWTLTLGGGRNSRPDTVCFTAGPHLETDGPFGTITPEGLSLCVRDHKML